MHEDIPSLIEQRPHLREPLELYDRWQDFQSQVARLFRDSSSDLSSADSNKYTREIADAVLRSFASAFGLEMDELAPLARALEEGEIDFMGLPFEVGSGQSQPDQEHDPATLLFLFSRPYFQELRRASPVEDSKWDDGRCPLCSARPALSSIARGPSRRLHCSWCGTTGSYRFMGCPNCGTEKTDRLITLAADGEPGFRISACEECKTYVKVVESSVLEQMTVDQADLASLPLDIVAQQKGYSRLAPNPIGLKKMV